MNAATMAEMIITGPLEFRRAFMDALDLACKEMAEKIAADRAGRNAA